MNAKGGAGWLHITNLKFEAAIFMLIALTFAAVLGQEAITSKELAFTSQDSKYYPYSYTDKNDGGNSVLTQSTTPLKWSCDLIPGKAQYLYCGYGLWLDQDNKGKGLDLSKYKDITIRFNYHGVGTRMKLTIQSAPPAELKAKMDKGETMPMVAIFDVAQGQNEIHLATTQFRAEQWWISKHSIPPDEAVSKLDNVISFAFGSGDLTPPGRLAVSVQKIDFKGVSISTAQWYLIILGAWLVATGAFLVLRFLGLRRAYEDRQRRQAEEARVLAEARIAAEDASAAKSQFLANMSHELRTPLNAILGYAQLLNGTALTPPQSSAVQTIYSSGEHLLTMITDILDIAKVEAGKLDLLPETFDIRACVQTVAQMIRLRAEEKGLDFTVSVAGDVPHSVVADQKRVRQVLINLLGNAIKFTQAGAVRMAVSAVAVEEGAARLRFDIIDTGIGIAPEHIGRIFRPFEQSGNSIDRSGGTGLGLSITHKIVQMMDGDITVESELGKGSRFRVEAVLPLAAADETAQAPAQDCGRYEVLIVDDRKANVDLLKAALESRGFRVRTARNGLDAVASFDTAPSDVVLTDLKMPVLDGSEAIRRIRARATRHVPVIAITANPSPEAEAEALAAGADRLLAKPVDLERLHQVMTGLLETSAAVREAEAKPVVVPQGEVYDRLLALAREGNLRAIRKEVPAIEALGPQYAPFASRLDALAAAWQSPAVLRLIEQGAEEKTAA
ncbi:ATP-binding protein [Asticcacaulis solisilvae]|uniref:ATP-binding protein n=1 Tax=Asticcacaulis solisilvae TaxID=1217274 RepID=UPI003FD7E86C